MNDKKSDASAGNTYPGTNIAPANAWESEAILLHHKNGWDLNRCFDNVVLRWLMEGDTRPLAWCFSNGIAPGRGVLLYLSRMLQRLDRTESATPYRLAPARRSGKKGRPRNPENAARDWFLQLNFEGLKETGLRTEDAIAQLRNKVAKSFEEAGHSHDHDGLHETVRRASYRRQKRHRGKCK